MIGFFHLPIDILKSSISTETDEQLSRAKGQKIF